MTIIIFILVLSALVFVHELGHFLAAKKLGVRVDEFALGFPPKLFGKRYGETKYVLNLLPIGGYVKIFGEDPDDESTKGPDSPRSFVHKPWWAKSLILLAGIFGNLIFAWILFTIGFLVGMPTAISPSERDTVKNAHVELLSVLPGAPGEKAGLKAGDELSEIDANGTVLIGNLLTPESAAKLISESKTSTVTVTYIRGGEMSKVSVMPVTGLVPEEPDRPAAGIVMALAGTMRLGFLPAVEQGFLMTVSKTAEIAVGLVQFFKSAFMANANLSEVTGPIGIAGLVGDASRLGIIYLLTFTAFISINLAVINVLPFPALDGGRLLFVLIEAVVRKPIPSKVANSVNAIGLILLLTLMAVVTVHDVFRLL